MLVVLDYVEVLGQRLPVHQIGGWWTRSAAVDGVPLEFRPVGLALFHEVTSASVALLAEDLSDGPQVNLVVGPDGAWWVVSAGATNLSTMGRQRPVDLIRQGQPPDFTIGEFITINNILLIVTVVNTGSWRTEQLRSLSLGCSLISRAMLWKGHRVIGERELTGRRFDLLGLDMDDLRRHIQEDELFLGAE